ncbi:ribosomal biogenesis protein LAS1L [Antechinus flavipes]|uniref:ribosomal biogenesis protein LAS1L n=1 Tax=Antechinus flavipes TaxID=38775 RepID=UPI002236AABF|nr:ribosomal biogenesis protein LAS1L [Antechinus flavipes]
MDKKEDLFWAQARNRRRKKMRVQAPLVQAQAVPGRESSATRSLKQSARTQPVSRALSASRAQTAQSASRTQPVSRALSASRAQSASGTQPTLSRAQSVPRLQSISGPQPASRAQSASGIQSSRIQTASRYQPVSRLQLGTRPQTVSRSQSASGTQAASGSQAASQSQPDSGTQSSDNELEEPRGAIVVPWRTKEEWDQVMVYLFCADIKLQKYALDRVTAWKSRCASNLPLAVSCTADLVRCKVMDESGDVGTQELIFLYGMALVRFVNLITESKQKLINIPLRRLAHEMQIPEWIINLRHDFTHRKLPRLSTCRRGCDFVLDWLRRSYWCRQLGSDLCEAWGTGMDFQEVDMGVIAPHLDNMVSEEDRKEKEQYDKIRKVLVSYEEEQFRVLKELRQLPKVIKAWANLSTEVEWMVSKMKKFTQENGTLVLSILLSDGFLIPTAEQLEALQIQPGKSMNQTSFVLPRCFSHFWQPLLKGLESQPFTQALLEKMFTVLPDFGDTGIRPAYLISWISELLVVYGPRGEHFSSSQRAIRKTWKIARHNFSLNWSQLLDVCLDCACWATPPLLHLLLKTMEPAFPLDTQEKLMCLCTIYTQGGNPNSRPRNRQGTGPLRRPAYTLEDLQWQVKQSMMLDRQRNYKSEDEEEAETEMEELPSTKRKEEPEVKQEPAEKASLRETPEELVEKQAELEDSPWQLCSDDVDWSKYPLGTVPGQTNDPNELMLDSFTMLPVVDQPAVQENENFPDATHHPTDQDPEDGEELLWTQSELHRIKSNLKFF